MSLLPDSDLDDAELWAVIDSAAASSYSVQKQQQPRPKPSFFSPNPNQKMNSKAAGSSDLRPSPSSDVRCLVPAPLPLAISHTTPDRKRGGHKTLKRFPAQQVVDYLVDEGEEESGLFSPNGEVVQRPWNFKIPKFENNHNGDEIQRQRQMQMQRPVQQFCPEKENVGVVANNCWNNLSSIPSASMFKHYQNTAMSILEKTDYVLMQGKPFIKKSGWRKIAFFFNISFEIKDRNIQFDQNSNVTRAEFVVRASMQGGRFTDAWGSCDRIEKRFSKPNHDIPSTAETRAKTRACQDLLGIGEYKQGGYS